MFTMKKIATLAVAGFLATSMFACSDPEEGDDSSSSVDPSSTSQEQNWSLADIPAANWTKTATITFGGNNNTSVGSALDIDALVGAAVPTIYKISDGTAAANKDKVDLLFDGTNLYTPEGCLAASVTTCPAGFKTAMTGYQGELDGGAYYVSELFKDPAITPNLTPAQIYDVIYDANDVAKIQKTLVVPVAPKPNGVYHLITALGNHALILVGGGSYGASATGETTLTIAIGFKAI